MRNTERQSKSNKAFTIVELLTVMSIIIVLMALLIPGLNKAKRYAKLVKQNAQFHSIDIALDMYNAENDGYPESTFLGAGTDVTTGSHRMTEALVGRDLQGFDPQSTWDAKADEASLTMYERNTVVADLDKRKGPYLKLDGANTFQACQLYGATGTGNVYPGQDNLSLGTIPYVAPLLTDVYEVKTVQMTNANGDNVSFRAGTPILYYKADTASRVFDWITATNIPLSIYNSEDNEELIALGTVKNPAIPHHFDPGYTDDDGRTGTEIFYETIMNPQVPVTPTATVQGCPYNKESYILISAGFDGIFGTGDDVTNFGSK